MKKYTLISAIIVASICITPIVWLSNLLAADNTDNLILLDQIEIVVYGQEDVEIITKSDIERPALGGGYRTADELVFERSVLLDAKKHKIPHDEESIDAGIEEMKREHNLSQEDLEAIFKESGYTFEEGRHQFQTMQMINTMVDVKVRSNLIVPRKDVQQYYNDHPEIIEATYTIERIFVPFDGSMTKARQKRMIQRTIKEGKLPKDAQEPVIFTINHSEISEQKQFIYTMNHGDITEPEQVVGGFEMLKLISKTAEHTRTLDERYREIIDILRRPKFDELMGTYRDQLMKNVSVLFL
jgi:hypothetical protein